jgi:uncharacterized glyoxalase superfamily protein PhnB
MTAGSAQRVVPMLSDADVAAAADWLAAAFGFVEQGRWADADGTVNHVTMTHDGSLLMLGRPGPHYQGPNRHAELCEHARRWSETPDVVVDAYVVDDDIDAHFARARAAGATILSLLEDNPSVGQRQYRAADPEGHRWMFAQRT